MMPLDSLGLGNTPRPLSTSNKGRTSSTLIQQMGRWRLPGFRNLPEFTEEVRELEFNPRDPECKPTLSSCSTFKSQVYELPNAGACKHPWVNV